ncbi:uncharacterized protein LOC113488595 [Athene cunicularia]|uniref:uncharacterized protein LOC113488595 n=1 Tax=Athene cunicularia TaxID=194338 RepID=UPI000EF64795|nr:uncharacterized protein LOC113488595 [Athene cunicularia]
MAPTSQRRAEPLLTLRLPGPGRVWKEQLRVRSDPAPFKEAAVLSRRKEKNTTQGAAGQSSARGTGAGPRPDQPAQGAVEGSAGSPSHPRFSSDNTPANRPPARGSRCPFPPLGYLQAGNEQDRCWEEFPGHVQKREVLTFICPAYKERDVVPSAKARCRLPATLRPPLRRLGARPGRSRPGDGHVVPERGAGLGAAEPAASPRSPAAAPGSSTPVEQGNGMRGQLAAKHSSRLSSPIIFVGKFYLFNLLHIMHRLINYCFSAGRTRVYRAI